MSVESDKLALEFQSVFCEYYKASTKTSADEKDVAQAFLLAAKELVQLWNGNQIMTFAEMVRWKIAEYKKLTEFHQNQKPFTEPTVKRPGGRYLP